MRDDLKKLITAGRIQLAELKAINNTSSVRNSHSKTPCTAVQSKAQQLAGSKCPVQGCDNPKFFAVRDNLPLRKCFLKHFLLAQNLGAFQLAYNNWLLDGLVRCSIFSFWSRFIFCVLCIFGVVFYFCVFLAAAGCGAGS